MKRTVIILFAALLSSLLFAQNENQEKEKEAIKEVIKTAYIDGIFNKGDIDAIKKGWYYDCDIMIQLKNKGSCYKNPAYSFVKLYEKGIPAIKPGTTHKIPFIHVTGTAAMAIVEVYHKDQQQYTDYMNLYKFKEGWKIVTKSYYEHKEG